MFSFKTLAVATVLAVAGVQAERHVVHFDNRCGHGTPTLIQGGRVLSTGGDYVSNGPLRGAIAYLQTGKCGFNGENCSLLETTLVNGISSTDVSLIPPHSFSVATGFGYYGQCDGTGANCKNSGCPVSEAFRKPDDYVAQRQCNRNDVNLAITFCA